MLINQAEAKQYVAETSDPILRHLLMHGVTEVFLREEDPAGQFDMLFYCKLLSTLLPRVNAQLPPNDDPDIIFG